MIWGPLEVEKLKKTIGELEICKFYEHMCWLFYAVGSLSFPKDAPELKYIHNFYKKAWRWCKHRFLINFKFVLSLTFYFWFTPSQNEEQTDDLGDPADFIWWAK